MATYRIHVVGGSCGATLVRIEEYLRELIVEEMGYACRVSHQNVWDCFGPPPPVNLILQTFPAYTQEDTPAKIVDIKPMVRDIHDAATISRVLEAIDRELGDPPRGSHRPR